MGMNTYAYGNEMRCNASRSHVCSGHEDCPFSLVNLREREREALTGLRFAFARASVRCPLTVNPKTRASFFA